MILFVKKRGDMITFNEREDSLREFFELKKDSGETISSIAKDLNIPERTLREFLGYEVEGKKKQRSLSSSNYNLIVNFYSKLSLRLQKMTFSNLVLLLENVNKDSIMWDFYSDFKEKEVNTFQDLKDFICEDMQIRDFKGKSLLELINPPLDSEGLPIDPFDPFERHKKLSMAKDDFDKKFLKLGLKIWGAEYYKFLMKGDQKEVFIFLSFEDQYGEVIDLSKKEGIFSPKQKEKPKSKMVGPGGLEPPTNGL